MISLFCFSGFWYSCTEDYFEFNDIKVDDWNPELALPLVNSSLSLEDLIVKTDSNGLVQENPNDGLLEVVYDGQVFSSQQKLNVQLPNQRIQESFRLPTPIPPNPNGGSFNQSFTTDVDFDNNGTDLEVDSILVKNGSLRLVVENEFQHNVLIEVKFLSFKNSSGSDLVLNFNLPPAPNASSSTAASSLINLDNYMVNMSKDRNGNATVNKIPIEISATFNLTPNTGSTPSDAINIRADIDNLDFREFYGYIGSNSLDLEEDTIVTSLFKNFTKGTFFIRNPTLDVSISNSFGIPVNFNFDKIQGRNSDRNPDKININLPQNPIALNFPKSFGSAKTDFQLNNANSNIDSVISFLIKEIIYNSNGAFNPDGKTSDRNFLTDTSKLGLDVKLTIPFDGSAFGVQLVDTIDFVFENAANTEEGLIRVKVENSFPLDAKLQLIFLDANFNPIDSLYEEGLREVVPSSVIDANGKTIQSSSRVTDVIISGERLSRMEDGQYVLIQAEMESKNAPSQNVKFFENYRLSVNVGIKAKFLIN